MDDELENFIRERKARVAEDKARLEQDPPYMEIKAKPHRLYGSTIKENIPPKSIAQGKEESSSVGLPLGVEYEKKKQRLQHELRMDYRRYMAQKKHFDPEQPGPLIHLDNRRPVKPHLLEGRAGDLRQRPPSRRDAATLTEDSRGLHRDLCLAEGKTLFPEEDEEQSSVLSRLSRHRDRLGRPVDQESEEEEYTKEELELMEGRRRRHMGVEASYEKRRSIKTDGREKRDIPLGFAREGRRSRTLTRNDDAEFATGLIIGAADTDEALQRRKECYRQELQEQIAEQHRNKKREKDLELKVAATGINDPEKQPDRIRQFGLSRRKDPQVLEPSATGESESSSRGLSNNEKIGVRDREMPPPDQPHVAFQSPVLEYNSALGLGGGALSPSSQPAAPSFPRAMDTPRIPLLPPHPPSTLGETYRSPYGEPHHYYGTRNLLDPNMAYYGHLSVPGAGLPVSYWNVPPGGAVPCQFGNHSPQSQHSGSSFPEPPIQPSNEAAAADSRAGLFPPERSRSTRERIYREALKQQEASRRGNSEFLSKIQEQQERRRLEREERERYEAQLEADMKNHQPWGRGGGGAPLRDSTGNLIADLNQMHKLNEEAYSNPEQWQRRATAAMTARRAEHSDPNERVSGTVALCSIHDTSDRLPGFTHVQTPQFARSNVFANQPSLQQLQEQDKYKAYLKQQIEEKLRKKAEERERTRLEEEREEKRLEEQRARIQKEYEEEQERKKRKEMEQKAKNEELIQLAEQRKKEAERKKKEEEEKESAALRRQYERERQARVEEVHREPSPPIPTLQKKHGQHQYTPRPPTVESRHSTAHLSERSLSGLQSPPVPACRNQLRAAGDQRDVFSELSALRRQLRSEQKRLEGHLQQGDWEELDSPLSERHRERPQVDVFDMARLRLQAPVRRPNSRNTEPRNLLRIHDSLQLKYTDDESRLGSTEVPKLEEVGVASRRRRDYRDPYQQVSSQRSTVQDDYFDLSPPHQNDYLRSVMGGSARGSLLESESAFIDPLGDAFPVQRTPELEKIPQLSARERRRLAKQSQRPQERAASGQHIGQFGDYSAHTGNRLQQDAEPSGEGRSRNRTGRLMALSRRGNTAGPVDLSDDDSSPPHFSPYNRNHQSSVETVATDPWMRPGTSDTLKCLDRPLRRERLTT
ncbi:centrosome and spindle pole-associated protein 1-like isoform X1 [Thunnus albacares]|uniref:centrosome and spindle pole-associated protein 1-like isoform X1 n=1 Tax=Thunnus albacares TaxID=8236 RepID=UPI001CF679A7|nr:centrosome and spindle pole-associated protein 1-like isoform X1 [Thunnus albacares]XP_044220222.1 centrosome and spindle pole-associated protein 1-like isoform X1 [Thunnus albacares]XP_044220223.1 centrosome and spindle pole-associated protein 1-like isoform X1 [Thunnus albacares]